MDAPAPDGDRRDIHYGLVLKGRTYQALFTYTTEVHFEPGPALTVDSDSNEKFFVSRLTLNSLFPALLLASVVVLISISVWQGWLPSLAVSQSLFFASDEYWRIFSALFQHADERHLINNLLPLVGLGWLLWGHFGFLAFPVVPILLGAVSNFLVLFTYQPHTFLIGISGTVFSMAGMWSALYLKNDDRFSISKRLLRAGGFVLILFFPLSLDPRIADRVHILGGALGIVAGYLGWGKFLPRRISAQKSFEERVRVL